MNRKYKANYVRSLAHTVDQNCNTDVLKKVLALWSYFHILASKSEEVLNSLE